MVERTSTIPEDENESLISSYKANTPNNFSISNSGGRQFADRTRTHPFAVKPLAEKEIISLNKSATHDEVMALISEQPLEDYNSPEKEKQMTESVEKLLTSKEDMPISQTNINNDSINEDIKMEVSQKEVPVSDDHFSENHISEIESIREENQEENVRPPSPEPVYFISKDPDPKIIAPVGGSGPTLTKTLVKPYSIEPDPPAIDPPISPTQEEIDEEELRKLEEEVEQLKKEAEANLINQGVENPGEISIIDEQTIFVDGKLKKKKKKKKKRKKIGGGEETIANITIDEVDVQQVEEQTDIKLNPVHKKKSKSKKNKPNTELNTVEEDSKEDLAITDIKNMQLIENQTIKDSTEEQKITPLQSIKEQSVKEQDENDWKIEEEEFLPIGNEKVNTIPLENSTNIDPKTEFTIEIEEENKTTNVVDIPNEIAKIQETKEPEYPHESKENKNKFEEETEQRRIFDDHMSPEKTETHEKSTEDQSIIPVKLPSKKYSEGGKTKKLSTKTEVRKVQMIPTSEMEAGIESYPGTISLLPLNCEIHREEFIKYFCRDEDCKHGLCQLCLYKHSEHDYIYADEVASFEIKQVLKATMTECAYKMKSQNMLYNETEKLAQFIDDLKIQEYEKIHYYFLDLHKELDRREKQLKEIYHGLVKDVEGILRKDISILENRMKEFTQIFDKVNEKSARFKMSNDLAIVANAHEVYELQRKVKNNNFEGKRLEIDDEEPVIGLEKYEESPDVYREYLKRNSNSVIYDSKENYRIRDEVEENHGEHVFFVQLDSELPMPQFLINISQEKK